MLKQIRFVISSMDYEMSTLRGGTTEIDLFAKRWAKLKVFDLDFLNPGLMQEGTFRTGVTLTLDV